MGVPAGETKVGFAGVAGVGGDLSSRETMTAAVSQGKSDSQTHSPTEP